MLHERTSRVIVGRLLIFLITVAFITHQRNGYHQLNLGWIAYAV